MSDNVFINMNDGLKRVMGNSALFTKLLKKFLTDTSVYDLDASFNSGDMDKTKAIVHTLKGIAANLSLTALQKQCIDVEALIKSGSVTMDHITNLINIDNQTKKEIEKVIV
jgi:HPt (histidine-containing phosphotransfer) domain-containing protein